MSVHRVAWWVASSIAIAGCGASTSAMPPAATAADVKQESIAQPCAELSGAAEGGYRRVFLQAAQVRSSDLQEPLDRWLLEHPVGLASVVSLMADTGSPATVSWSRCLDAACATTEPWQMTVTPALPASASGPVQLAVQLREERGAQSNGQSATLETRSQKPVAIDLAGADGAPWSLIVTPYLIGDDEDLRKLAECKARAAGGSAAE